MERAVRVNLVTNWTDQKGLWRDGCIVEEILAAWGHQPVRVQYTERLSAKPADLNLFLETVRSDLLSLAPLNWWAPNPEWCRPEDLAWLPRFHRILCKTHEAERLFVPLTDKAVYTGFESEDRYDPDVPREHRVLHIAGGSILKGTQAVLAAWEQHQPPYPLTVVGDEQVVKPRQIPNVTYRLGRLPDDELKTLQNSHLVHLQPSETEGWGHTIYEGLSVGAMVVTTRGEAGQVRPLPATRYSSRCLAQLYRVAPKDIANGIIYEKQDYDEMGAAPIHFPGAPRSYFLHAREQFRERLKELL
jgi:hypothetical protein